MDDIVPELYNAIKKTFDDEILSNQKIKSIVSKIKKGNANYEDMLLYSKEIGICLEKAFSININENILPDGKMYYNIAKRLIEPICKTGYNDIASHCAAVQTSLNKKANIGLKGIKPSYKQDKVNGIVDYISNADSYSQREKSFLQSLSTYQKSVVDDSVKENADFHYKSGLSPKIIRRTSGKTCKWCQNLAGIYNYADVKDTGSDVFRRHANCDCTVIYDPGNGSKKVQDVWNKQWNNQSKYNIVSKRLKKIEETKIKIPNGAKDVTKIYLSKATPKKGKINNADFVTINGNTYYTSKINKIEHKNNEVEVAEWIKEILGGNIYYLPVINEVTGVKSADFLWNDEFWDLKEISGNGKNTLYHAIEKKKGQSNNFIFDMSNSKLSNSEIERQLSIIFTSKKLDWIDKIMIKKNDKLLSIYEKKKK